MSMLEAPADGRWVVQLMVTDARERDYLLSFLAQASRTLNPEDLFLYPSGTSEFPRVGVVYGTFPTRSDANSALVALPEGLRRFRPYVRAVEAVRADVRRGPRS